MTFNSIVVNFDSPEEQKEFEEKVPFMILGNETWQVEDDFSSWTEFDITGCTVDDIKKYFSEE